MAGPLTNASVAAILFAVIMSTGVYILTQFADGYNVPIESNFTQLTAYQQQALTATAVYDNASQGATINSQSVGSAQLQGLISAEQTKTGFFKLFTTSINDFFGYFPVPSWIPISLIAMLLIMVTAMIYRAIRGVDP